MKHPGGRADFASTRSSKIIDNLVSSIATQVVSKYDDFTYHKKQEVDHSVAQPDGGIFINDSRKMIVTFEAKHQQDGGNALERWYMNQRLLEEVAKEKGYSSYYVTLASGEGAYVSNGKVGTCEKILSFMHNVKKQYGHMFEYKDLHTLRIPSNQNYNISCLKTEGFTVNEVTNIFVTIMNQLTNKNLKNVKIDTEYVRLCSKTLYQLKGICKKLNITKNKRNKNELVKAILQLCKE